MNPKQCSQIVNGRSYNTSNSIKLVTFYFTDISFNNTELTLYRSVVNDNSFQGTSGAISCVVAVNSCATT